MIYTYEDEYLNEYSVQVDFEKLQQIGKDILENCSVIKHCFEYIDIDKQSRVAKGNYHEKTKNTCIKNAKIWSPGEYSYDEYMYPDIINIISEILNYNFDDLSDLFNTIDVDPNSYNKFIIEIQELLSSYMQTNDEEILKEARNLIDNYHHGRIEQPKKSIKEYYNSIQECFDLQKINSYREQDLSNLKQQFGDSWYEKIIRRLDILKTQREKIGDCGDTQFIKRINERRK